MRVLYDGYDVMQEQQEMEQHGVDQHTQAEFNEFAEQVNNSPGGAADAVQ